MKSGTLDAMSAGINNLGIGRERVPLIGTMGHFPKREFVFRGKKGTTTVTLNPRIFRNTAFMGALLALRWSNRLPISYKTCAALWWVVRTIKEDYWDPQTRTQKNDDITLFGLRTKG